jgi:SPP1 gp7 family putative phage head morphogenesis protein
MQTMMPKQTIAADAGRRHRSDRSQALRGVHANVGITAAYRRRLDAMVEDMNRSVLFWVKAAYRANPPEMAQDATPADDLQKSLKALFRRWEKKFDEAAPRLAAWFAQATWKRSDAALRNILRDGGFSVRFQMTRGMRDVVDATTHANVNLIKSIPQQYMTQVESLVMTSVQAGRDLGPLAKAIQKQFGVTKRRAALIARDQNNKATGAMQRARQIELGMTEAVWMHSHGGKEPRPTHLANDGKTYDLRTGWFDSAVGRHILPGELVNCRCVGRPITKGFS